MQRKGNQIYNQERGRHVNVGTSSQDSKVQGSKLNQPTQTLVANFFKNSCRSNLPRKVQYILPLIWFKNL